jgi:AraC-like DNA-binding protein
LEDALIILFLLASVQGLLLTVILFTRKENHSANIILACSTLTLSISLVYAVYYIKGWYYTYPHLMGLAYPFPFLFGPLFYLYARLVSKQTDHFRLKDLLHFIPVAVIYLITSPYYFISGEEKIRFVNSMVSASAPQPLLFTIIDILIPLQGIAYTVFTIRVVSCYNRTIRDTFSNIDRINLTWLKSLTVGMVVIWSFVALTYAISFGIAVPRVFDEILNVLLSILVYSIGYNGLNQPEIFMNPFSASEGSSSPGKYQKSGLNDKDAEMIRQKLLLFMKEEKPYLEDSLTMQKLAERLNVSTHNLSEVINSRLNLSYYDFINGHRVEEFKSRIANPANDKYNILTVAFDSGFKSKGTFNSIFKKNTRMTPSEYISKLRSQHR